MHPITSVFFCHLLFLHVNTFLSVIFYPFILVFRLHWYVFAESQWRVTMMMMTWSGVAESPAVCSGWWNSMSEAEFGGRTETIHAASTGNTYTRRAAAYTRPAAAAGATGRAQRPPDTAGRTKWLPNLLPAELPSRVTGRWSLLLVMCKWSNEPLHQLYRKCVRSSTASFQWHLLAK